MFSEFCSISALSCSFEFVVGGSGGWFQAITLSQPNYSYGCFVVEVVVVVVLWSFLTFWTLWAFLGEGVGF